MLAQSAHILRNGHFIVVEHQNQPGFGIAAVVERLIAHAARQGAIPHHSHHMVLFSPRIARARETQRGGNGCGRMPGLKAVVHAFAPAGKARQAAIGTQRVEGFVTSRNQLMGIGLMPHIKEDFVLWRVKYPVQRQRDFHHPQIGGQVAAVLRYRLNDLRADIVRQLLAFLTRQAANIRRVFDLR